MALDQRVVVTLGLSDSQTSELLTRDKCLKCIEMEARLATALRDLLIAETIISMLSADLKLNSAPTVTDEPNLNLSKWSTVGNKISVYSQNKTQTTAKVNCNIVTSNRFSPLEYSEDLQAEVSATTNKEQTFLSPQHHEGSFNIPTILNGVVNVPKKRQSPNVKHSVIPHLKSHNTKSRHIRIIGDSHLKGTAGKLKLHLNSQFSVLSIIKPNAKTNLVLDNQQEELKLLGKKDFLIVSAGTNDLNTPIANINNSIAPLITFVNKMDHTDVLVVNIPYRYDLGQDPVSIGVKRKTARYSKKLQELSKLYPHISTIVASPNREYYTKHGLHLNNYGKETLVKQIVTQINSLKLPNNCTVIPLPPSQMVTFEDTETSNEVNQPSLLGPQREVLIDNMILARPTTAENEILPNEENLFCSTCEKDEISASKVILPNTTCAEDNLSPYKENPLSELCLQREILTNETNSPSLISIESEVLPNKENIFSVNCESGEIPISEVILPNKTSNIDETSPSDVNFTNTTSDNIPRTSARLKKTPITRNNDFLWEYPVLT